MSTNGAPVLERVKKARADAVARGENPPGRDALVAQLGISLYQAQRALKTLKENAEDEAPVANPEAGQEEPAELPASSPDGQPEAPAEATLIKPSPTPPQPAIGPPPRPWPLVLIGFAAAVAVWSGWVGLGAKCGFGLIQPLPGIADDFTLNTAITLPISVEAYAAYALRVWLSNSHHSARTITFAKWSTVISLGIGVAAQAGYHLLEAFGYEQAPWLVVLLVSSVPVAMVGLASGLAKLVKDDRQAGLQQ